MKTTEVDAAWAAGIARVAAEAAGVLTITLMRPAGDPALFDAALGGDIRALGLLRALVHAVAQVDMLAAMRQPALCLTCPATVRPSDRFIACIAAPHVDAPRECLATVVCPRCAARPALDERVIAAMRAIWPDARSITVHRAEGRA